MFNTVVNFIISAVLIYTSFVVDKRESENKTAGNLVNLILFLGVVFFMMGTTLLLCMKGTRAISLICGRVTFMMMGWFSVLSCNYILLFPNYKKTSLMTLAQVVLFIGSFYVMFFAPNGFNSISVSYKGTVQIMSGLVFSGSLGRAFPFTWLSLYGIAYRIVIPFFVVLMVLVRAENIKNRLLKQNMFSNIAGVVISWIVFWYMSKSALRQPNVIAFLAVGFLPSIFMFVNANSNTEIKDFRHYWKSFLRILTTVILPIFLVAVCIACFLPVARSNFLLYQILLLICVLGIIVGTVLFRNKFGESEIFRNKKYGALFEKDLASLDFDVTPMEVIDEVFRIFNTHVDASFLKILIEDGNMNLNCVYSSDDDDLTLSVPVNATLFDSLMNIHRQVIFKEFVETSSSVAALRRPLLDFFDKTGGEAVILLNEGRQLIGVLILGKKQSGNVYSEYDYEMFNKYYSNLFVFAYYIKNIMNEAVVGTVNREIRMSGQIITSIQENMDFIKNPKIDVGYLMVPAHNIGGEFVDMIRLTDTRYIYIVGALSGKGIAASMSMVILKSIIRTFLSETTDFKLLVAKVNSFIRESLPKGTFFSGTFGLIDFNTDTMYYINCGTPAIFVYTKAYNNIIEVQGEGYVLGFVKDITPYLRVKRVKLSAGDIVMTVTDGIIDTRSLRGDIFGKARTQSGLIENSSFPAEKMAKFTYDSLVDFTSKELENDVTILIMKYLG